MRYKEIVATLVAAAVMVTMGPGAARASALLYRAGVTGRWVKIVTQGDTKAGGAFAGSQFEGFSSNAKAPVANGCGVTVAVVAAELNAAPPNTGIFLADVANGTLVDVAVEGGIGPKGVST